MRHAGSCLCLRGTALPCPRVTDNSRIVKNRAV
jgi:hypothetical protein